MLQRLTGAASRLLGSFERSLVGEKRYLPHSPHLPRPSPIRPLTRVVLTDEISRTLFKEFAAHRRGERGKEEIGWVLLGIREVDHAVVLATLPAGAQRSAGVAHVQFNCNAQAVASRIVRQWDKRLVTLGVVHTHPGSLRHPSDGDFQGDSVWVSQLRGGEGIFGIGTADGPGSNGVLVGKQPEPNVQSYGPLLLSWYALGTNEFRYRPLEVHLTIGPDLALRLHDVWTTIEAFAEPLERLCVQQAAVSFDVVPGQRGSALAVCLKLAEPTTALRIVLEGAEAGLYWQRGQELLAVDLPPGSLDRSVYLVLAELAGQT